MPPAPWTTSLYQHKRSEQSSCCCMWRCCISSYVSLCSLFFSSAFLIQLNHCAFTFSTNNRKRVFILLSSTVTKPTSALDIQADSEVMMQNGTTGTLRCTFKSDEVVSSSTSVTWSFQSSQPDSQFSKAPYTVSPCPPYPLWEDFPQLQDVFLWLFYLCDTRWKTSAAPQSTCSL